MKLKHISGRVDNIGVHALTFVSVTGYHLSLISNMGKRWKSDKSLKKLMYKQRVSMSYTLFDDKYSLELNTLKTKSRVLIDLLSAL